jgi:hypothetical protein
MCTVTPSHGSTTRHRPAQALLRLCRASRRVVPSLDFWSVGRTGSRHAPGHSVLTTRHPAALALLRLCRAFRRAVSSLDFSLVGHTGSRRAPGHFVSRLDYSVHHRTTCCSVARFLLQPYRALRLLVTRSRRIYFEYAAPLRHRLQPASRLLLISISFPN